MKKIVIAILSVVMLLSIAATFTACGTKVDIGILLPAKDLDRWYGDGLYFEAEIERKGYNAELQFADNDPAIQANQLENMVAKGVKAVIICAIDGSALKNALERAKEKDIIIMAYDSLIMNTAAVDYFITHEKGITHGKYIEKILGLKTLPEGQSKTIEFLAGDYGDSDVKIFYDEVMSVLQPYLDSGKLICPSGNTTFSQVVIPLLSTDEASEYFEDIIDSVGYNVSDNKLDAVITSNNAIAIGVIEALENAGFALETFPVITGQLISNYPPGSGIYTSWPSEDILSVINIVAGYQSMSIFEDARILAIQTLKMALQILKDEIVSFNGSINNNVKNIPTYFCDTVAVTKDNYEDILIRGIYSPFTE